MARRIAEEGFATTVWARRPAALERFADLPVQVAGSLVGLAAASDVVGVCVTGDRDVEEVVGGPEGILAGLGPGGIVVVHSTVHPSTCLKLAEAATARDVRVVDAPVSGGGPAAEARRLLVMAGGAAEDVDRCRPVFAAFADPVVHLGPLGSGQLAKLLNNVLFTANLATSAAALELGAALGVEPLRLAELFAHGSGASFALGRVAAAGGTLGPLGPRAGALLHKDVGLLAEVLDAARVPGGIVVTAADSALESLKHPR